MRKLIPLAILACLPVLASAQIQLISGYNFGQFIGAGFPALDGTTGIAVGSIGSNFRTTTQAPNDSDGGYVGNNGLTGGYSNGFGTIYWNGTNGSSLYDFSNGLDIVATDLGGTNTVNGQTVQGYTMAAQGDSLNLALTSAIANGRLAFVQNTTGFSDYDPTAFADAQNVNDGNLTFSAQVSAPVTVTWYLDGSVTPFATTELGGTGLATYAVDLPPGFYGQNAAQIVAQFSGTATLDNVQFNGFSGPPPSPDVIIWKGGSGVWSAAADPKNWLDGDNVAIAWSGGAAVFQGNSGTVSVDIAAGAVEFSGLKFLTTGYNITGGNLTTTTASTVIEAGTGITATISSIITGTGGINKTEAGTLVLSGANTYTGGTTVTAGTLRQGASGAFVANSAYIVNGGTLDLNGHALTMASLAGTGGTVSTGSAALTVNQTTNTAYAGVISGTGSLTKSGTGTLTLSGVNSYTGTTTVNGGTLLLNGAQTSATGAVTVANGGKLGGTGTTGGIVTVQNGGTLTGQSGSTLTMSGLVLNNTSNVDVSLGAPGTTELFKVNGNLTLDGTLNVTAGTGFGEGLYRLFAYTGQLTNNTLALGTVPGSSSGYSIQTSVAQQVNLISAPVSFPLWTGSSNIWSADPNAGGWGSANGAETGGWQPAVAIFAGGGGTITVDNTAGAVVVKGVQLADDDFTISGGTLTNNTANAPFRVGDGTTAGSNMTGTIASVITGTGGVDKTDLGTLVLTGANTHTGGTRVSAGVLAVNSDSALGASTGALRLNGGTLRAAATLTSARSVTVSAAGGTVDTGANNVTLSGVISGSGALTKRGVGNLTITGSNTNTGTTTVAEGALIMTASSLGSTSVASGARLSGTGTIRGNLANSGTVSPGASPGTITIVGNFTQSAGGTYVAELASATSYDKLVVNGAATLGGTLNVVGLGGFVPGTGQSFKIIEATGGITGTFANVVSPWSNLGIMRRFGITYGANDVSLGLTQLPFAGITAATANQQAVGAAVDAALASGNVSSLVSSLNALPSEAKVLAALDQVSPQRLERWFEQAVHAAASTVRLAETHMGTRADADARKTDRETSGGLWLEMLRRETRSDEDTLAGSPRARGTADGIVVGGDVPLAKKWLAGVLFGYTNDNLELDGAGSTTSGERFGTALYTRVNTRVLFEAVAGMNYAKLDNRRTVAVGNTAVVAESKVDSNERFIGLRTGMPFRLGGGRFTPYLGLNYVRWSADEATESGAGDANLTIASQNADSLTSRTGFSLVWPFVGKNITVTPRLDLAWWHEYRADPRAISASLGGNLFTVQSRTPSENGLTAGLGLDATFGSKFSAYARLASEWATTVDESLEARAGLDYRF